MVDHTKDNVIEGLIAAAKSIASMAPGLAQVIAAWDAIGRKELDRNLQQSIILLNENVGDLSVFFQSEWFKTPDGKEFLRKVLACALDSQMEEKREFFINALVHGAQATNLSQLEKLKFVDMLRRLSKAALMVLADLHVKSEPEMRQTEGDPKIINPAQIAAERGDEYKDRYLVTAAISELESEGVFSRAGAWGKHMEGASIASGFSTELYYTEFSAKFVEFISKSQA